MNGIRNVGRSCRTQFVSSVFMMLATVLLVAGGASQATAQGTACPGQNWAASTPNIWAASGSIKVMLNNDSSTNQPTIPIFAYDGNFNPWGYQQHPQTMPELNSVWSCPSGTPVISVAGSGRETVSFQLFISAGVGSNSALSSVSVAVSPLTGPGTLTSDNTQTSNVTRYLEGYVPYTSPGTGYPQNLQSSGQIPDPLIPFYDPYDTGNPAVATPFNVQSGTTQGVWVNISIPANQAAGTYNGSVTVSGNGIGSVSIPVSMTVWNGNLPTFDAGSVDPTYADMLRSWLPFYEGGFVFGEGLNCYDLKGCGTEQALYEKYQVMGHNYDTDVQIDGIQPVNNGCYPTWGSCTSYTSDGTTSTLDWTTYDTAMGPALTPGGLFSDGTYMRVFDSPLSTAGAGAWVGGGWSWTDQNGNAPVPPSGLMQLVGNYSTQISQHFASNHTAKSWGLPELISYTFDETYNSGHSKDLGGNPLIYQIISSYNEAINSSNSALSATWNPSTSPIRNFLTDLPSCEEQGDNTAYTDSACADHINLSYPGGPNATAGYTNSWVVNWSSNPALFMPGQPGPALSFGYGTTLVAGTGYKYTQDLTQGVPALSTAPVPIERWFYQGGDPFSPGDGIGETGVGWRANYWIAYKYGLDETIPSAGAPNPVAPAPGTVWDWVGNFWGGYNGSSTPSDCSIGRGSSTNPAPSPFVSAATGGDGVMFYPGNEVGCYYSANPVGKAVLTANPAVNTSCTSSGYNECNGISGPVASMRLESLRRGYEDYEYMYLLGKKSGRAAPMAIINSLGGAGMTAGGLGTTSWNALNWQNVDASNYVTGVEPTSSAYTGNCTDSTAGIGGLSGGLPNGPTGSASSGDSSTSYNGCTGEWTNNPDRFAAARVELAQQLGFAPPSTTAAPTLTGISPSSGAAGASVTLTGSNLSGATSVTFGSSAVSPTSSSATSVTAVAPSGSGAVNVTVTTSNGTSNGESFTYETAVAAPSFSPGAGTYTAAQSVAISDSTSGATIRYTTDGSTPTETNGTVYSGPVSVASTETLQAIGYASGMTDSSVTSATYTIAVSTLPSGWSDLDIGSPAIAGSGNFSGSTYTVKGGGADIWGTSDQFNYTETAANGDVTITARVSAQQNTNGWAKAGVMIRDTSAANAAYVFVFMTPSYGAVMQYRSTTGGSANQDANASTAGATIPYWVRLVRSGSTFTGSTSPDGVTWTTIDSTSASIGTNALGGLAVTAHDNTQLNTSTFDNVSITTASPTVTYPLTDSFSGSGALSSSWVNTTETTDFNGTIVQAGGQAVPSPSGTVGFATYTGATFTNDQYSQTTYLANSPTTNNNTGPCVRTDKNGDGYCYYPQNGQVWSLKAGAAVLNGVPGTVIIHWQVCPVATSGDTVQISAVGTTITCKDVTTGASASVSDSSISTGNPGIMVDQRGPSGYGLGSFQADCVPSCGTLSGDVIAVNSGGSAAGIFAADEDFSGGGAATYANTIDTTAVANPAPVAVYQTERYGVATYTIPGLSAGKSYVVRLHFAEIYWTQAGQRIFNVSINGTTVLPNFDIIATAGAANKALVETFAATANSSGQIVVALTNGSADQAKISGIEVQ